MITVFVLADLLDGVMARIERLPEAAGAPSSTPPSTGSATPAIFAGLVFWFVVSDQRVLAGVALFCLAAGALVSYVKARAEGLGMTCDVGLAERPERLVVGLVAAGLGGLGVPYVLAAGLWLLAAASAVTVVQRLLHVRRGRPSAATAATPPCADRESDEPTKPSRVRIASSRPGTALGWAVGAAAPRALAALGLPRLAADRLWQRRGKSVRRLESNLARVRGHRRTTRRSASSAATACAPTSATG